MASKQAKAAPAKDELDELFEGIGDDAAPKKTGKPKPAPAAKGKAEPAEKDILAELENQLGEAQPSRPHTPRIRETAPKGSPAAAAAVKRASTNTPPPDRSSEEKPAAGARKSAESARSYHASFTPSATSSDLQESEKRGPVEQDAAGSAQGGWWGGWGGIVATASATATAAMKQAEAAYKEIQHNEEAKKWAEQVRGNVGALRGLGDELRHRALPTFTNILHTLAPPISSHERLLIHITHDMVGYPSLDPLIHGVFSRVMSQVEGGDLLVIQRGQESTLRSPSSERPSGNFFSATNQSSAGWRDGPWWRQGDSPRDLGLVKGLAEGTKLCRVSAEAYAQDYFGAHGGIDAARQRAVEPVSETNPVRSSDIFLGVQGISVGDDGTLFAGSSAGEKEKEASAVLESADGGDELVSFAVFILDPVHEIQYSAVSQALPAKWVRWLDAPAPLTPASAEEDAAGLPDIEHVPEDIRDIVDGGGVDPREWVAEWVEEALSLAVGVVAQRYVARRMGVGEGGIGKGKRRMDAVIEEGGGEAARAGVL